MVHLLWYNYKNSSIAEIKANERVPNTVISADCYPYNNNNNNIVDCQYID